MIKVFSAISGFRFWHRFVVVVSLLSASVVHSQSLQPLTEEEMGSVTGQEGIMISLEYYYNSEKTSSTATTGRALSGFCSTPNGSTSLGNQNCRLAIQIANHQDYWIVVKNGHASISVKRLSLDAAFLGDAGSATDVGFYNDGKFRQPAALGGACLLEIGVCNTATIQEMPALRTHYSETAGAYDPVSHTVTGYDDVRFGLYYEGMAVEFNSAVNVQDGWQLNDNGSFLGLNIADNNGNQAGIAFGGDFYLYGF